MWFVQVVLPYLIVQDGGYTCASTTTTTTTTCAATHIRSLLEIPLVVSLKIASGYKTLIKTVHSE